MQNNYQNNSRCVSGKLFINSYDSNRLFGDMAVATWVYYQSQKSWPLLSITKVKSHGLCYMSLYDKEFNIEYLRRNQQ